MSQVDITTSHSASSSRKRVLFVAHDFPPGAGIGGGLRSASFTCHLPSFGWLPKVFALDAGQERVPDVVRLKSLTPWRRPYELGPYGWACALHRHLRRIDETFDLVYVSCPPFPQAFAAAAFARRRKLPLVVDFRDAWSLDPYQEGSRLKKLLYRHLFPSMERALLGRADLLILNTSSALVAYQTLYPRYAHKMCWLPNGFDETAFPEASPAVGGDELVLIHAGRFGIGARSPSNLLSAIAMARQDGCRVRLEILGDQPDSARAEIAACGVGGAVTMLPQISYQEAVAAMSAAGVLVLMQAPSNAAVQAVAGKTFDYLRAGRPILYIGPPGDNLDLVRSYAARHEHPTDAPRAIADAIARLCEAWQRGELSEGHVDAAFASRFERRVLAGRLAGHFDHLVDSSCP